MKIAPIRTPLPGEHLAATAPDLLPQAADVGWRQRLNFWAGRALTADALELEQENRAARLAWRGRPVTPGVVHGLETGLEAPPPTTTAGTLTLAGHFAHVFPGYGIAATGEDAVVPRMLRVSLDRIPLLHARFARRGDEAPGHGRRAARFTTVAVGENRLRVHTFDGRYVPWAAVLILRPAELGTFGGFDPADPCERDPSRDAFADERRLDAARFLLVALPPAWRRHPRLAPPGVVPPPTADPRWRNRLAHVLFGEEAARAPRQTLRFQPAQPAGERWETTLAAGPAFPWELLGVPLALLGVETVPGTNQRRWFLDRAAVVRPGGWARARSRPVVRLDAAAVGESAPGAGTPSLWRARVDQFAEHLGSLDAATATPADQARSFQFVPPAGLLPRAALDFLTTEEAVVLPPAAPGAPPDRAAVSRFFPSTFAVEVVPIPTEDLDAALAASAPLAPLDLAATAGEPVRVLVPLAQRVFDPNVLVVEAEDPIFASEVARLVAGRQEWRQNRNAVRGRRDDLQRLLDGPRPPPVRPPLEPGQLEPEPTEGLTQPGFTAAYVSPADTDGSREIRADFSAPFAVRPLTPTTVLYVRLRLDPEQSPGQVVVRWRRGDEEFPFSWVAPSDPLVERTGPDGAPLPMPLWRMFTVTAAQLGVTSGELTGFTLHLEGGRAALRDVGQLLPGGRQPPPPGVETSPWWNAEAGPAPTFLGGEWSRVEGARVLAPLEDRFEPVFEDGNTLDARVIDLDNRLRLPSNGRTGDLGLLKVIENAQRQLDTANDAVDLGFLKTQSHVHRIRSVLLGEEDANRLLTSPALNSVVKTQSARVAQEDLVNLLKATATTPTPRPTLVGGAVGVAAPEPAAATHPVLNAAVGLPVSLPFRTGVSTGPTIKRGTTAARGKVPLAGIQATTRVTAPPSAKDIYDAEPAVGQGFDLRTLTIAKRFDAGPVLGAFDYADVGMREALALVVRLRLPYDENDLLPDATTGPNRRAVNFRELAEGKVKLEDLQLAQGVSAQERDGANLPADTGAILAKGIRRSDATALILRRIEFYLARLREQLERAREILDAVNAQIAAASNRLLTLESRLAEARHDVSVARALRQEERARVAAINARRDALLRDEVKFLAYVRPRAVESVRRHAAPGWRLDAADAPAPVPACLRRHDQPPDALRAYVQLFRAAPARWFRDLGGRLRELDTREKLGELLAATQRSALGFTAEPRLPFARNVAAGATQNVLLAGFSLVGATRNLAASVRVGLRPEVASWDDFRREAEQHSALGDLIEGRHGQPSLARRAAGLLEQIEAVATCLHAEFAAVPPGLRLGWVERYSQFDRPAPLDDLSALPRYGSLDRAARRRFQAFVDWLFERVTTDEPDAFHLVNDLVRICLLLASHAPVKSLVAGHLPRPVPVRPGGLVPVRPFDPTLVRVGMEVHFWRGETVVAQGRVEDLRDGEVSARVNRVQVATTTLDPTVRVQFVAPALGFTALL